jgi:hypothetical protein
MDQRRACLLVPCELLLSLIAASSQLSCSRLMGLSTKRTFRPHGPLPHLPCLSVYSTV